MKQEELWDRLQKATELQDKFASMSNAELANLLLERVWANIELFSYESELLDVAIDRLRSGPTNTRLRLDVRQM